MLPDGFCLFHGTGLALDFRRNLFRVGLLFQMGIRLEPVGEIDAFVIAEVRCQGAKALRFKVLDFLAPFHQDCQRRCLYPAH